MGVKTQTRRTSKRQYRVGSIQPIQENYHQKAKDHIYINRRWRQCLMDVTQEEAKAEGFNNLAEFLEELREINGYIIPWQTVTAYEFQLIKKTQKEQQMSKTPELETKVICPFCGAKFQTAMEMIRHDNQEHD